MGLPGASLTSSSGGKMGSWVGSKGMNSSGLNKDGERVTCWEREQMCGSVSPLLKRSIRPDQPLVQVHSCADHCRLVEGRYLLEGRDRRSHQATQG